MLSIEKAMGKIKENGDSRLRGNDNTGEIVLYQPEGEVRLEVRVENDTVWLTQAQMAELFDVKRQAITKHVKNIFETRELEESATSSILELVQKKDLDPSNVL